MPSDLLLFGFSLRFAHAQTSPDPSIVTIDGLGKGTVELSGPWRFHIGDDLRWAEPSINDTDLPVLTLPSGETVQINLFSDDVNHSFYVPAFLFKRDAIQGVNNSFDLNIDNGVAGQRFIGECTQFCGTYHPYMRFWVQVMGKDQFNTWLAGHHGLSTQLSEG